MGEAASEEALAAERDARQPITGECMICMDTPKQVRFDCGHAVCCRACLPQVRKTGKCPTCSVPLGATTASSGAGALATFEPVKGKGAGGRGRGGRGGRGKQAAQQ